MLICPFFLWVVTSSIAQVPAVYLCTTRWRNDITGLYSGMCIGYAILVLLYSAIAFNRYVTKSQKGAYVIVLLLICIEMFQNSSMVCVAATGKSMRNWHTNDRRALIRKVLEMLWIDR